VRPGRVVLATRVINDPSGIIKITEPKLVQTTSRNLLLQLSTNAFRVGLPGRMKCNFTLVRCDRKNSALPANSVVQHRRPGLASNAVREAVAGSIPGTGMGR